MKDDNMPQSSAKLGKKKKKKRKQKNINQKIEGGPAAGRQRGTSYWKTEGGTSYW